jgi:transcriptional regulator with XRE-family HTH domain
MHLFTVGEILVEYILENHTSHDPKERGKRLKLARNMAGLTREDLEQKYGISASTIQSWEAAKAGGLTEKGANRAISVLRQEGIWCTIDWLLNGIGSPPQASGTHFHGIQEEGVLYSTISDDQAIQQELNKFRILHTEVLELIIADDAMLPYYRIGDYVMGKPKQGDGIQSLVGTDCIVETSDGEILLRRLRVGMHSGVYTLFCTNPDTEVLNPTMYNQALKSAAAVLWMRRPDPQ